MLSPMIFVGVGGSGGNTVRAIRENLWRELINRGWTGEFPDCWQTLWIDTISVQDKGGFAAPPLPQSSYLGLVPSGVSGYADVKTNIVNQIPGEKKQETLAGWMPQSCPVPIAKGAGQFRAIGRTIGVSQFQNMKMFLEQAISSMNSTKANNDLNTIASLYNLPVASKQSTPSAFVISSMAGGSGSGLFQDVAHMLKLIDPQYDSFTHVMLYGADVFELSVKPSMRASIPGNTLGALAETMSGVWRTELTEASEYLFTKSGFNTNNLVRYGGKHHWLIGAKNQLASLGSTTNEIYRAVASSLSALATSPDTLVWLNNYILTNVFAGSATNIADNTNLKDANQLNHFQPFASMGFSRISLGMDRFSEFASQAIAKAAVQRLLWPDYEPIDQNGPSNDRKIEVRTEQLWNDFREKSGLNERNPSNDVLDYLKPKDDSRFNGFAEAAVSTAAGKDGTHASSVWEDRFVKYFTDMQKELINRDREALLAQAQSWTEMIQDRILEATTDAISTSGLRVGGRLVKQLRSEIEFLISSELPADLNLARKHISEIRGPLNKLLNIGKKEIPKSDGVIDKAKAFLKTAANEVTLADRLQIAIELLIDLDKNFLAQLAHELEMVSENLKGSTVREGADFDSFPTLGENSISQNYAPANTDQSLIDYKEFPILLEEWSKQVLDGPEQSSWQTRLIERTIRGVDFDKKGDEKNQEMIGLQPRWVPQNSSFRIGGSPMSAGFIFRDDYIDFLECAKEMLVARAGSLSDKINMGLRSYVENNANPSVVSKRRDEFKKKLVSALQYCSPMVEENGVVLNAIHPGATAGERSTSFSQIPFENTALESDTRQLVLGFDPTNTEITKSSAFSSSDSTKTIEFYSTLANAKNPAVFDSLMKPIAADWKSRADNASRRQAFWTLRRTKPLMESIPVAQKNIDAMILGWFALAFIGGRVIDTSDSLRGPKVSIFSTAKKKWIALPHPLLGLPDQWEDHDVLPAALLSLSIALVSVNETASLDPLFPYQCLIETGGNDKNFGYRALYQQHLAGNFLPDTKNSPSPEVSREKLQSDITKSINYFTRLFDSIDETENPFTTPQVYEIRSQFLSSLDKLLDAATRFVDDSSIGEVRG